MVPSSYRLDEVTARLVERLEAARPSFVEPAEAASAFLRIANDHLDVVVSEYREMMKGDRGLDRQEALLRQEVLQTFLPRYTRHAAEMNASVANQYGLGFFGTAAGRVALAVLGLLGLFVMVRFASRPYTWPLDLLLFCLPILPDFVRAWRSRTHQRDLQAMVDDMQRIQEQATAYLPAEELSAETQEVRPRTRGKEGEWRN